ncbi:sensor histidine kinase [Paenibacillus sp. VCA1]|uniref:sensor histidine kinase n=1 Tax=Paenibacillus sp. VCA1 TaxID=3039148 RepID=UPI002871DC43|nr:sensor histidine kinase [Paenibacillus sp. VCA1]MDR9856408.1 sensor histidine kinase [Paenibacillus sp. VCA1]
MNNPIHILVAEDDNDISRLLCSIIKKNGYIPQPAYFLFDRFYTADRARSAQTSGLGLPIAKSLMNNMGGTLTAELNCEKLMLVCRWKKAKRQ